MADTSTSPTPGVGRSKGNGFGMFVMGLVLGIIVGGFAGAVLLPFLNQQSYGTSNAAGKTQRPAGAASSHQREQDEARQAAEEAARSLPPPGETPKAPPSTDPAKPAPTPPTTPPGEKPTPK